MARGPVVPSASAARRVEPVDGIEAGAAHDPMVAQIGLAPASAGRTTARIGHGANHPSRLFTRWSSRPMHRTAGVSDDGVVQEDPAEPSPPIARITRLIEQGRDREAAELGAAQLAATATEALPDDEDDRES